MDEECTEDVFLLEHHAPEDFEECICQRDSGKNICYLIFLRFLDFFFLAWNVWCIVYGHFSPRRSYCIYFDFWARAIYNLLSIFHLHGVGRNWRVLDGGYNDEYLDYMPWDYKLYWVLYSTFLPSIYLSYIVYHSEVTTSETPWYDQLLADLAFILVLIHFFLVAFPVRIMHFYFFAVFYIVYILFTLVYQAAAKGGVSKSTPIYKILDWKYPGKAVLAAFSGFSIGVGLYLLFCLLSMFKMWCRDRRRYSD